MILRGSSEISLSECSLSTCRLCICRSACSNLSSNFDILLFCIYLILSTISLESHFKFTFSRLISFVALGHSSVDRVVTDKIKDYIPGCVNFSFNCQSVSLLQAYLLLELSTSSLLAGTGGNQPFGI